MPRSESPVSGDATPGLILERFDYTRVGEHLAVAQVQAGLTGDGDEPSTAELFVRGGQSLRLHFRLQSGRTERRLRAGGATEQVWRGLFTLPVAFAGRRGIVFELSVDGEEPVILPFPFERPREPRGLELMPLTPEGSRIGAPQFKQAVALATAVAVTASSTPAAALANAALSSSRHHAAQDHLIGLARVIHRAQTQKPVSTTAKPQGPAASGQPGKAATKPSTSSVKSSRRDPARQSSGSVKAAAPRSASKAPAAAVSSSHGGAAASCTTSDPQAIIASAGSTGCSTPARHATAQEGLGPTTPHPRPTKTPKPNLPAKNPAASSTPAATPAPATASAGTGAATTSTPTPVAPPTGATMPGPSGGVAAGTGGAISSPTSVATNTPAATLPAAARVKAEPVTHRRLPVNSHHAGSGGSSLSGLTKQPPVKLTGVSTSPGAATLSSTPPGFTGPASWTGTSTNDPALQNALGNLSQELEDATRPPRFLIPIYMEAGRHFHVPWEVLAAINSVESNYGRNLNTSSAGAIGWMQFEPSTWERYGLAMDGHSVPNPYDPRDAIFSAAKYLAAAGAEQDLWGAIYAYNHASWYVNMVLTRARAIAAGVRPQNQTRNKRGVISVFFAAFTPHHRHRRIRYKGGVLSHYDRLISAANMVSAANFPYVWGGGHEQPARFAPFDCSGSVSYVMQQAGYKVPTTVSGNIPVWKFPAGPGRVTIFYNTVHTFMRIGSRYFGTSGFARPSGGAGWFSVDQIPVGYLDQFSEVHVPHLGVNSFAPHHRRRSA